MALAAGTRLGPYEIQSLIGAGGMGEVYKARDTRLGRSVAIKILPGEPAADPDRRRRFEQEARAASALNHPHICVLHDIGSTGSPQAAGGGTVDYLVMEYLEGQTLADKLAKGPLPIARALEYAVQIADALAKAHREGIVHRDLKPGNVMITKMGAKLLDFGLARLSEAAAGPGVASATLSASAVIVGTVPYMAPEQVQGLATDARTDIFAFGAVLYEMLTDKRAFDGESQASVIAAILERDPAPLSSLRPLTPPALDRIITKCLAKDPDARWQSAADLGDELKWLGSGVDSPGIDVRAVAPRTHRWGWRLPAVAIIAAVLATAATLLPFSIRLRQPQGIALKLQLVPNADGLTLTDRGLALSPDGQTIVFAARAGETTRLYARRLDQPAARPLSGTEGGSQPFFSPDGKWVGFIDSNRAISKVPVGEGTPQPIWKPQTGFGVWTTGAAWGADGVVFGRWPSTALCSVSADGGRETVLLSSPNSGVWYLWPEVLPGGRAVLFTRWQRGAMSIAALRLPSKEQSGSSHETPTPVVLIPSGSRPRYLPTGHLLYESEAKLFGVAFDPDTLRVGPHATALVAGVPKSVWWGSWRVSETGAPYSISSSGTLAFTPTPAVLPTLAWVDRRGRRTPLSLQPRPYLMPVLSPDGRLVADTLSDGPTRRIWIGSVDGTAMTPLTAGPDDCFSLFTPDGKWLLFTSNENGRYNVFRIPVDHSGPAQRVTPDTPHSQRASDWSPDGTTLLFNDHGDTSIDILALANGKVDDVIRTPERERNACFAPDARWIAYESSESGVSEIYVRPYPSGAPTPVSSGGGFGPVWRGNEVFYQGPKGVMSVRIAAGRPVGQPEIVFLHQSEFRDWDISRDGQRFLVVEGAEASRFPPLINIFTNWFEELNARVPAR